jgi:hypothetical protein
MIDPATGEVANYMMAPQARQQTWVSLQLTTDATVTQYAVLSNTYDVAIEEVYAVHAGNGAGDDDSHLTVGISGDADAIVESTALSYSASAGDVTTTALASTEKAAHGLAKGSPVVSAGEYVSVTVTQDQDTNNTGDVFVYIVYSLLDPNQ